MISLEVQGGLRRVIGGVSVSTLGTINCFAGPGSGEGNLIEVIGDVSGIIRLRKCDIAFVCVFRLISASRIL